jgi:soluble lytic murein transglycosylase-like protein
MEQPKPQADTVVQPVRADGNNYEPSNNFESKATVSRLERKIDRAIHQGNPIGAEDLMFAELKHRQMSSHEMGIIQGKIAAGFHYAGVTEYARKIANQSAATRNPLGVWISGITAWKMGDAQAAAKAFATLVRIDSLSPPDKATASFWAWRALKKIGRTDDARQMLIVAADRPRNFYGILAKSLLANAQPKAEPAMYPLPKWQPQGGYIVDRALVYALMRHESRFNPNAESGQGACGLMQLMPATADLMDDGAIADRCTGRLMDPAINIALGQKYVRHLTTQKRIGDNLVLLLAAYNGGPGKLSHIVEDGISKDPLLFIESLPKRETRNYVRQVLIQYWNYQIRLGQSPQSIAQLAQGQWPRVAMDDGVNLPGTIQRGSVKVASNRQ